jgi:hypothetical protein
MPLIVDLCVVVIALLNTPEMRPVEGVNVNLLFVFELVNVIALLLATVTVSLNAVGRLPPTNVTVAFVRYNARVLEFTGAL